MTARYQWKLSIRCKSLSEMETYSSLMGTMMNFLENTSTDLVHFLIVSKAGQRAGDDSDLGCSLTISNRIGIKQAIILTFCLDLSTRFWCKRKN